MNLGETEFQEAPVVNISSNPSPSSSPSSSSFSKTELDDAAATTPTVIAKNNSSDSNDNKSEDLAVGTDKVSGQDKSGGDVVTSDGTAAADGAAGSPVRSPSSVPEAGDKTDSGAGARRNGKKNYIDLLVRASVMSDSLSMSDSSLSAAYARRNSAAGSASSVTTTPSAGNVETTTAATAGARARLIPNDVTTLAADSRNHNDSCVINRSDIDSSDNNDGDGGDQKARLVANGDGVSRGGDNGAVLRGVTAAPSMSGFKSSEPTTIVATSCRDTCCHRSTHESFAGRAAQHTTAAPGAGAMAVGSPGTAPGRGDAPETAAARVSSHHDPHARGDGRMESLPRRPSAAISHLPRPPPLPYGMMPSSPHRHDSPRHLRQPPLYHNHQEFTGVDTENDFPPYSRTAFSSSPHEALTRDTSTDASTATTAHERKHTSHFRSITVPDLDSPQVGRTASPLRELFAKGAPRPSWMKFAVAKRAGGRVGGGGRPGDDGNGGGPESAESGGG